MKYALAFLILITLVSCSSSRFVQILPGACKATNARASTITGSDHESELCLVTGSEQEIITWRWSKDGSVLAYALHNASVTLPALSGRTGYYRPPATHWHIADRDGSNARRFSLADNKGLYFSPDGKYAIVQDSCYYATCQHSVYQVDDNHKICEYETRTVWFGKSNCPRLTLKNGQTWDIREEVNDSGCAYYEENEWDIPFCTTRAPRSP